MTRGHREGTDVHRRTASRERRRRVSTLDRYRRPLGPYPHTLPARLPRAARATLARWRRSAFARSPVHYEPGDMRRDYEWTRAALTAGVVATGSAVAGRLLLTGLFVAFVTANPALVAAFNLAISLLGAASLLLAVAATGRRGALDRGRWLPDRLRRWLRARASDPMERL